MEEIKAQFKSQSFHVPNQMQTSSNKDKGFCSLTLDSVHEKFDVWTGPKRIRSVKVREHEAVVAYNSEVHLSVLSEKISIIVSDMFQYNI